MTIANSLWHERYRPRQIEDYVWRDNALKSKVQQWIHERAVPHIIFVGNPGTGKTSLAYLLLEQIGITDADILYIPASRDNKTDDIIEQIRNFVSVWAENDTEIRYIILDEADSLTWQAQGRLRADMDIYEANCRIIFTANRASKLIDPIKSRCEIYQFQTLDRDQFMMRLIEVMQAERIDVDDVYNLESMSSIVDQCYPDLRRSIGMLQKCTIQCDGGRKLIYTDETLSRQSFLVEVAEKFAEGHYRAARTLVLKHTRAEDYPTIFEWLYQNLELFGKTEEAQDEILIAIRKGVVYHDVVANPEINLSATMAEITMISKRERAD